jgi:hypothetical protein
MINNTPGFPIRSLSQAKFLTPFTTSGPQLKQMVYLVSLYTAAPPRAFSDSRTPIDLIKANNNKKTPPILRKFHSFLAHFKGVP